MAKEDENAYEEARKQRLEGNLKRLQDLGILKISKSLSEVANSGNKLVHCHEKPKSKASLETLELRRSSRERNTVTSYREVDEDFRHFRTSCGRRSSTADHAVRTASYEERVSAMESAEKLQSNLKSDHPSFVKSMVRSHVSSCFWLGLPRQFCKEHLPPNELNMILEDENGSEYDAVYIGSRTGLSGGWRGFAMDHKLDDGDALVFELAEPMRFKVYIVKASESLNEDDGEKPIIKEAKRTGKTKKNSESLNEDDGEKPVIKEAKRTCKSKKSDKQDENSEVSAPKKLRLEAESTKRAERAARRGKL